MTSFFDVFWCVPRDQAERVFRNPPEPNRLEPEVELHWERTSASAEKRRDLPDFLFYELKSIKIEGAGP